MPSERTSDKEVPEQPNDMLNDPALHHQDNGLQVVTTYEQIFTEHSRSRSCRIERSQQNFLLMPSFSLRCRAPVSPNLQTLARERNIETTDFSESRGSCLGNAQLKTVWIPKPILFSTMTG